MTIDLLVIFCLRSSKKYFYIKTAVAVSLKEREKEINMVMTIL